VSTLSLKPAHAAVKKYYATLQRFARGHFDKEGNIRGAFEDLLKHCARQYDWTLGPEYSIPRKDRNPLSVDGALLDAFNLPRGYWEAKDEHDSLEVEMKKKFEAGYPRSNILFQHPTEALLFQDGQIKFNDSIEDPNELVRVLRLFFEWRRPPIVDFMVRSVEEILKSEFGRSLSDKDVHILDPFVGTGNFIVRVMQEIKTSRLPHKYREELHCNEIMLLPYYIASMNIEHAYLDRTEEYEPFEGICLVDTFDMRPQMRMFAEKNLERIERQRSKTILVTIGNPPYNAGQENENDNNRNRRYLRDGGVDLRVAETYAKASRARNKNALSNPYVKAIRWATDRIRAEGVVAFVTNSGFLEAIAADGMRMHLARDFDEVFILDLGGNVRKNPKLSGTTHNVFGIKPGVSINILVRRQGAAEARQCRIHYATTGEYWTRQEKYNFLTQTQRIGGISWAELHPDSRANWLTKGLRADFENLMPTAPDGLFRVESNGLKTNRDRWVYNFNRSTLEKNVERTIAFYNQEAQRWKSEAAEDSNVDDFVTNEDKQIGWSDNLKSSLERGETLAYQKENVCEAIYRPFVKSFLYFDRALNERVYRLPSIFPNGPKNRVIWWKVGGDWANFALATDQIPDLLPEGGSRCFPLYTYDEDGSNRRDNITDWALAEFRSHYGQRSIAKLDIFHYVYALLHHVEYRTRYAANLKRELPRIPFAPDFAAYARIGCELMKLHIDYEKQLEYPLQRTETGKLDWRVEKMALSKDKTQLKYNSFLSLSGIPPEVYEYRLGNRSALEWVIDQYRVSTDKRSGIVNDPNREDDAESIVRLIGQVVTVSLETVRLVRELSALQLLP